MLVDSAGAVCAYLRDANGGEQQADRLQYREYRIDSAGAAQRLYEDVALTHSHTHNVQ